MIEIKSFITNDTFFAARNGLGGFESMFPTVFSPDDYDKIYILKGGPGTGKSTLMRGVVSFANELGIACEAVLCSSDVSSLDGVILSARGHRAAILDGTAPHTADPKYPGAVEEIINLGDGFDVGALERRRKEIKELNASKQKEYADAYSHLRLAQQIFERIWHLIAFSDVYNLADETAEEICEGVTLGEKTKNTRDRLYSAFGKDGYKRLPLKAKGTALNIKGEPLVCSLVMRSLHHRLEKLGRLCTCAYSALDNRMIDRLYTPDCVFTANEETEADLDLRDYTPESHVVDFAELSEMYRTLLCTASTHFKSASTVHFEIENIYKSCVNFDNNDRIFSALCDKLSSLLA